MSTDPLLTPPLGGASSSVSTWQDDRAQRGQLTCPESHSELADGWDWNPSRETPGTFRRGTSGWAGSGRPAPTPVAAAPRWEHAPVTPAPASPRSRVPGHHPTPQWPGTRFSHLTFQCSEIKTKSGDRGAQLTAGAVPATDGFPLLESRSTPDAPAPAHPPSPATLETRTFSTVTDKFIEVLERADSQRVNKKHGMSTELTGSLGCRFAGTAGSHPPPASGSGAGGRRRRVEEAAQSSGS